MCVFVCVCVGLLTLVYGRACAYLVRLVSVVSPTRSVLKKGCDMDLSDVYGFYKTLFSCCMIGHKKTDARFRYKMEWCVCTNSSQIAGMAQTCDGKHSHLPQHKTAALD